MDVFLPPPHFWLLDHYFPWKRLMIYPVHFMHRTPNDASGGFSHVE